MIWLRRALPYLGILILIGLIYDGYIFYSRWSRQQEEKKEQAIQATDRERKTVEAYGGLDLRILTFYAAPGVIARGAQTNLCYGVTGAKNVKIDPPVDAVWPALTRCVQVSPRKNTEYKLTAEDEKGKSVEQTVEVKVNP